jgi:cytoskeletal protein RodZ
MVRLPIRPVARLVTAFLLLVTAWGVQAQWQWRDERGQMQFSDLPPPRTGPEQNILQRPNTAAARSSTSEPAAADAASAPATAAKSIDPALEARRRQAEQQQAAQRKADEAQAAQRAAEQRVQNCGRAREQVRLLESGQRITRTNARGEREFLDDAARGQELGYARQVVAAECR